MVHASKGQKKNLIVLYLLVCVFFISCGAQKNLYLTSVGVINNVDEIEQGCNYQMSWIDQKALDDLSSENFRRLLEGSRYYFISTSDVAWVKKFAQEQRIKSYKICEKDSLIGVVLDTTDVPTLIPVDTLAICKQKRNRQYSIIQADNATSYAVKQDDRILLRLLAAINVSNNAYSNVNSYVRNNRNSVESTNIDEFVTINKKYTFIINSEAGENVSNDDILAISHCELRGTESDKNGYLSLLANAEILPCEGYSVVKYGVKQTHDNDLVLQTNRYEIEKFKSHNRDNSDRLCQNNNKELWVPYNYTWQNQDYSVDVNEQEFTWNVTVRKKKNALSYCFADESLVKTTEKDKIELYELKLNSLDLVKHWKIK